LKDPVNNTSKAASQSPFEQFVRLYEKDDVIFEEGSIDREMFIVYSGSVDIYKGPQEGKIYVATVGKGDFFGEMTLIDKSPRSATAIAAQDSQLIVLDEPKFIYLIRNQPQFGLIVMQRLCDMLRKTTQELASGKSD
jgi:CRP/FNR family transcriptional regulator, cyclic AMP receptor protein